MRRLSLLAPVAGFVVACSQVQVADSVQIEQPVEQVKITSDHGVIEVVVGDAVRLESTIQGPEGVGVVSHQVQDGVFSVAAQCAQMLPCTVDLRLVVPADVAVSLELDRGEIWATGVDNLTVELDNGLVDLAASGAVVAAVGHGTVRASLGAEAQAKLSVAAGDVEVVAAGNGWSLITRAAEVIAPALQSEGARGLLEVFAPSGRVTVRTLGV